MKTAVVCGALGQDGSYLTEYLRSLDYHVVGITRRHSSDALSYGHLKHLRDDTHFDLHHGDICDPIFMTDIICKYQPDEFYSLAAQSVHPSSIIPMKSNCKVQFPTIEKVWKNFAAKNEARIETDNQGLSVEVIDISNNESVEVLGYWNGMGTWFPIKQISRHKYVGKLIEMTQKMGRVILTPNHCALDSNNQIFLPIENKNLLSMRKLNWIRHNYLETIQFQNQILKDDNLKKFLEFLAFFIAEGWTSFNKANGHYTIGICSQDKEHILSFKDFLQEITTLNWWLTEGKKDGFDSVWQLTTSSRTLFNWLRKNCGKGSENKKIPGEIFLLSPENQLIFLKELIRGDGCYTKYKFYNGMRYTTKSQLLISQLSFLFTQLKKDYTIQFEDIEDSTYFHLRECTGYQPHQGTNKIKYLDYDGYVYDISVPEVTNFTIGLGNIVVHNSHVHHSFTNPVDTFNIDAMAVITMLSLIQKHSPKTRFYSASTSELWGGLNCPVNGYNEQSPFYPRSPYGVAKLAAHWATINYREAYGLYSCAGLLLNHECLSGQTPVVIRDMSGIDIKPVQEVVTHRKDPKKGKKYSSPNYNDLEVWDGNKWTKIITMTATWNDHKNDKGLIRVSARGGSYEATSDHISFLDGEIDIKTSELNVGDILQLKPLPSTMDITSLTLDEAEFLGLMCADGSISEEGRAKFINKNKDLINKVKHLWFKVAGGTVSYYINRSGYKQDSEIFNLNLNGNSSYLKYLREQLYTEDKYSRVPKRILNSNNEVKIAFLKGFNLGDGTKAAKKSEFQCFTTDSQTLALGLWYLVESALGYRMTLHIEERSEDRIYYKININSPNNKGIHLTKDSREIKKITKLNYIGWVFDLETESGTFSAGIGNTWVHNSPRRGYDFITRKVTSTVAKIALGLETKLVIGNTDAYRDWGHSKDFVQAMYLMLQQDKPQEYVIATGVVHSVQELIDYTFMLAGFKEDKEKYIVRDQSFMRPSEVPYLKGDASRAKKELGWEPTYNFYQLIAEMYEHDYNLLKAQITSHKLFSI